MDRLKAILRTIPCLLHATVVKPQLLARPMKGATLDPLILKVKRTFLGTESFRCVFMEYV